ncbi:hypothetical protein J3B02_000844 [Coemansia erecta]|uniref:RTA1 like protein n=1 Tax=Coemansia asiatica TaxID=1052880 RepID=A0A9W8CJ14_9FUNG|nr:hypothetical protein LPJ64_002509 [Coemansia asiatica]KAJ2857679.1 hypothetical protein J3B02_000844 [Coemansia erecta]KAJ2881640.1 hypothetical protein FB639_002570 [Coemansia asiatica]
MPAFDDPSVDNRLRYFTYMPADVYPEVSLGVYFVVGSVLLYQTIRSKAQGWVYILAGTAFAESLGYIFRTVCVYDTTFAMYVLMTLFLLLPPNALALVNYKTIAKIIEDSVQAKPNKFWLRPKFVNWFYFSSDVFSIAMQGAGGGMMTTMKGRNAGKRIVLVGLTVQLFFFACYLFTTFYVWRKPEYAVSQGPRDKSPAAAKRKVMLAIVLTTLIIYLRSIYRIAEFADGYGGKIYSAEWAFYVFDTILIFIAFLVYIVLFIGPNFSKQKRMADGLEHEPKVESESTAVHSSSSSQLVQKNTDIA